MAVAAAATQNRTDSCDQLHHAEGLGDIIVRASVQTFHPVIFRVFGGQHDDRKRCCLRVLAKAFQNGNAVFLRKHDVQQNKFGQLPGQRLPEEMGKREAADLEALAFQGITDQFADAVVVLNEIDHVVTSICLPRG